MGALVTICPVTGKTIETGVDTDSSSMELTPPFTTKFSCPHCRTMHPVSKRDLFVCELVDGVVSYQRAA